MAETADETLADEQRRRLPAGVAAIAAGVLSMGGSLLALSTRSDFPAVSLLEALRERTSGSPSQPGIVARKVLYFQDNAFELIFVQLVPVLAIAALAFAVACLYRSTAARQPELKRGAIIATIAGAVLIAVPTTVGVVAGALETAAFAGSSAQTESAARDVLGSPVRESAAWLAGMGGLVLGLGFIMTVLNAMRVGLLTRFMGVLGIIVGVLFILPLGSDLPLVQVFWLIALGSLFLGYWPPGRPPAWITGEAQPWPTQQEIREQRLASQAERGGSGLGLGLGGRMRKQRAEPPETPAPEPPARRAHPSSKKRKGRRR